MTKEVLADQLRNHINGKLDSKADFYSSPQVRIDDLKEFFTNINKDKAKVDQIPIKTIRPSYERVLEACLKNRKIDPSIVKKNSNKPKFNTDMNVKIEPRLVAENQISKDGKPIQTQPVVQTGKTPLNQPVVENFDEEAVSATFSMFFQTFRLAYPEMEVLSESEKKSLGKMWVGIFNRYLASDKAIILVPTAATLGMLIPKLVEGRKKKKLREKENEIQDTPKHLEETPPKEETNDTPKEPELKPEPKPEYEYGLTGGKPQITPTKPIPKDFDKDGKE